MIRLLRSPVKFQERISSVFTDLILDITGGGTGSATATGARTNLGLGSMAVQNSNAVTITGGTISGNGAGLTNLNATNLASGTVPDARFPSILPAVSGQNLSTLNASNLALGTVPDGRFPAVLPAISGQNLTNLNASNITSGTVNVARLGSGATATKFLRGDNTWADAMAYRSSQKIDTVFTISTAAGVDGTSDIGLSGFTNVAKMYFIPASLLWQQNSAGTVTWKIYFTIPATNILRINYYAVNGSPSGSHTNIPVKGMVLELM